MSNIQETRNREQELALQIMYGFLISQDQGLVIDFENSISEVFGKPYKDVNLFVKQLLLQSLKNEENIIDYCQGYLKNWKFNRLNTCVQAILILSIANHQYVKEANKAVIIDVAVKLSKKYGSDNDYKFVNAVLDNCLK